MATKTQTKSTEQTQSRIRRNTLAYVGLYGLAYDRAQIRRRQAKELTTNMFEILSQKGETTVKQAEVLLKQAQTGAWKNYAKTADRVTEVLPKPIKSKVDHLEAELVDLQAKFERMNNAVKPKTVRKAKAKVKSVETVEVVAKDKPVKFEAPKVETTKTEAVVETVKAEIPATVETKTPRHIPYFLEVKRYDPLADEDVVRKIVNHCGIALRSEDAKYVACSDESERATVRDSWLKRKLGLDAVENVELDKKVLDVCGLMQRDMKKNRVTFYYLLAKKERLLSAI